ncbi:MaoC/PaaZ C-terminal domain-containing protein [Halegenticoccus tardaugens]|uniref:MaoC/PaaZ C-terminal domain-containing protein n=1 Tax=Halegenticoccus tardaugens TaxID=2071624 RepID=UPI00100BBED8|nr:MaoC/PaaZ C-terminal domain-containing protein [Halegenticoccus tardaugens]
MLYYEDLEVGAVHKLGSHRVTRDELVSFAEQYDPRPRHVGESTETTTDRDVVASGWQVSSICMRLLVDGFLSDTAALSAFGLEELRWEHPVRPGDTITAYYTIADKRVSNSRGDRGYVVNEVAGYNQRDEEVVSWQATTIFERRE